MKAHVGAGDAVGYTGLPELLPRLDPFNVVSVRTVDDVQREGPRFFVLNADYSRAVPPDSYWGQLVSHLRDGSLGYRLVFRYRQEGPWSFLPGGHRDLTGAREETLVFSVLRDINPLIEVFQRDAGAAANDRESIAEGEAAGSR